MLHEIIIKQNDAGQRLDKFCAKYMPSMPKNMLYKLIRQKDIRYNRKRCRGNEILKEGDILHIYAKEEFFLKKEKKPELSLSSSQPLSILSEDENFLFLYKPVGQDVHSGGKNQPPSLIEQVQAYLIQKGDYSPLNRAVLFLLHSATASTVILKGLSSLRKMLLRFVK